MEPIRPIITNPGGVVDPADLIGRERELERLLKSINTGGAKLLGDRRMGKTSLITKAADTLEAVGHEVIRISAESSDPILFTQKLLTTIMQSRVFSRLLPKWEAELGGELRFDIGPAGFRLNGKASRSSGGVDFLRACLEASEQLKPYRVVFFFDEITVLAEKLGASLPEGPEQFFRMLRAPRQRVHGVSMVLTGSVGLHHVLTDGSPVNDLDRIPIGPLSQGDAFYLARCLLSGSRISCSDDADIAAEIVEQTCAIPYYIHQLVQELGVRNLPQLKTTDVRDVVDYCLREDLWEMQHYLDRIPKYYGTNAIAVQGMLDEYAASDTPLTVEEVLRRLLAQDEVRLTRDEALQLVVRMEDDHYLQRVGKADQMATSLLRRAWLEMRRP